MFTINSLNIILCSNQLLFSSKYIYSQWFLGLLSTNKQDSDEKSPPPGRTDFAKLDAETNCMFLGNGPVRSVLGKVNEEMESCSCLDPYLLTRNIN